MSYKIYCDGDCIFDINIESLLMIKPVLTMEDSMAGTLEFTMPPTHSRYDSIRRMRSVITVERDGVEIWEGRPIEENIDFYKRKKVTCEGALAYLNDTTQPQWEFHDIGVREFLTTLLSVHNSKVSSDKQFQTGIVTVTDPNDSLYRYTNRETTLNCIRDKLLDRLGGHLRVRKSGDIRYLDYLADSPRTCEQTIEFGKNLLDFSQNFDASDFVTAVIPLGARLDESEFTALESRVTIKEVNDGRDFIYSSAAVLGYGWIEQTVIWDDVNVPEILKRKAEQYLSSVQFEKMVLEVSAVDLHNLNTEIDNIEILDQVRVISTPHGLNRLFPVTRRSIPLAKPSEEKITFGSNTRVRLTNESRKENTSIIKEIEAIPTKQEFLESARQNATQLIHNALNGHVVITDDADELLIMDTDDIETATKVWRWNLNGLGYSSTGYDGEYGLAITMDGTILGDRLAAGTVSAAKLDVQYTGEVEQGIANAESAANHYTDTKYSNLKLYTDTQITNTASEIKLTARSYTDNKLTDYATKALLNNGLQGIQNQLVNYATKSELTTDINRISAIVETKADVATLDDYATKSELSSYATKSELTTDINGIRAVVETKADTSALDDYATKSELSTDIEGIQTVVDTKADTSALDNYATKSQLNSYATKSELTVGINGIQSQVSTKVDQSQFSTLITQNAQSVKVAWNNISNYVSIENGGMSIYDENNKQLAFFGQNGETFTDESGGYIGSIGGRFETVDYLNDQIPFTKGLTFALDTGGHYMGFAAKVYDTIYDKYYISRLMYVRSNSDSDAPYDKKGWHLGDMFYAHQNVIQDAVLQDASIRYSTIKYPQMYGKWNNFEFSGFTGTIYYVSDVSLNGGTLSATKTPLTFSSGILLDMSGYPH